MEEDPWPELSKLYSSGMEIKGKVMKNLDKGVIFELDNNIIHLNYNKNLILRENIQFDH